MVETLGFVAIAACFGAINLNFNTDERTRTFRANLGDISAPRLIPHRTFVVLPMMLEVLGVA